MTFPFERRGALMLAAGLVLTAGGALAQSSKPTPAAPAAPAQNEQSAQSQALGPARLELSPSQDKWLKTCGKDQNTGKDACFTVRQFGQGADQPPMIVLGVYQMADEDRRIVRILLPVGVLLRPGFRLVIDKDDPIAGAYDFCFPNGCFGEADLNSKTLADFKKAQTVNVVFRNQARNEVTFVVPVKDFGAAFDGPAVDPKETEEKNQELQKELEQRAKEQREKLEQQQSGGAAATPAPTPTTPPAK